MIKRNAEKRIKDWIINGKDALLVEGARQTGKTYLIRECLNEYGTNTWSYTPLGKVTDKSGQELEDLLKGDKVTIKLEME